MKPILYTTHCPKCRVLETKLQNKHIEYDTVDDKDKILEAGIRSVPMLYHNGHLMDFLLANKYINSL